MYGRKQLRSAVRLATLLLVGGLIVMAVHATTLTVPGEYQTIQAAIDAAVDGDTVEVADGTYTGTGNKNLDYGGKAITLRSQSGPETCIIDCENSGRGFNFHNHETAEAILEGFTIRNGSASVGGAVWLHSGSPAIINCVFADNTATSEGGAVCSGSSEATFADCEFHGNRASEGGAISNTGGASTLTRCVFQENTASSQGGAIESVHCTQTLTDCQVMQNSAEGCCSGVICSDRCTVTLTRCQFLGNVSRTSGAGGLDVEGKSHADVHDCLFVGNSGRWGAGIWCGRTTTLSVANTTFSRNAASDMGGALYIQQESGGSVDLTDCVLWADTKDEIYIYSGSATVTYTDIAGGYTGAGNMKVYPKFVRLPSTGPDGKWGTHDDDYGDLRLQSTSPCIDTGDPTFVVGAGETDLDGKARVWDGNGDSEAIVDMGAYEFGSYAYGDLNCDGALDFGDIDAFVAALTGPEEYRQQYPNCNYSLADINRDGSVDFNDIDPFVECLVNGGCP